MSTGPKSTSRDDESALANEWGLDDDEAAPPAHLYPTINDLMERGLKQYLADPARGKNWADAREKLAGRYGWRDDAFPVYQEAVSRGATTEETIALIRRAVRGVVKDKTIRNQISIWRRKNQQGKITVT